ncbi:MAG: SDR family NAD(P)-dependent oxidoreductase [Candidatus Azotimanducaceae bacterium WSBS_2022_MAG_OTU7]
MGAQVVFCARSQDAVNTLAGYSDKVTGLTADMGDKASTETFLDAVEEGGCDILVNNVGASPSRNFLYMTDEQWQELHEIKSAVCCPLHPSISLPENESSRAGWSWSQAVLRSILMLH